MHCHFVTTALNHQWHDNAAANLVICEASKFWADEELIAHKRKNTAIIIWQGNAVIARCLICGKRKTIKEIRISWHLKRQGQTCDGKITCDGQSKISCYCLCPCPCRWYGDDAGVSGGKACPWFNHKIIANNRKARITDAELIAVQISTMKCGYLMIFGISSCAINRPFAIKQAQDWRICRCNVKRHRQRRRITICRRITS